MDYRNASIPLGDLYQDIYDIEMWLHRVLKGALERQYGHGEKRWWLKVRIDIRKKCADHREDDNDRHEPWCYLGLTSLQTMLKDHWDPVKPELPPKLVSDRKKLLGKLNRPNEIRRFVMHPSRGQVSTEDDFEFVHELKRDLGITSKPSKEKLYRLEEWKSKALLSKRLGV